MSLDELSNGILGDTVAIKDHGIPSMPNIVDSGRESKHLGFVQTGRSLSMYSEPGKSVPKGGELRRELKLVLD